MKLLKLALLGAALALGPNLCPAAGFPTFCTLNSEVGNSGTNYAGAIPTTTTNTPLVLPSNLTLGRWLESLAVDQASGASNTVQVILYDCSITANCTSSTIIDTLSFTTNSAQVVTDAGTSGYQRALFTQPMKLDYYLHAGLGIATVSNNPDTVTATVNLGKPSEALISVSR